MAPLTRARAGREGVPNELMAEYYTQRASAGLIISEATGISREGLGWPNAPGLWNEAQVEGWKLVTGAVQAFGLLATAGVFTRLLAEGPTPERVVAALPALAVVVAAYAVNGLLAALEGAAQSALAPRAERVESPAVRLGRDAGALLAYVGWR